MKKIACTLLIDDNENTNFLHQMMLEDMGISQEILLAGNGREAIEVIRDRIFSKKGCPDLILLDINMPVMDGYEFMAAFDELGIEDQSLLIVAMLTISLKPTDIKKLQKTAAVEFLKKPLAEESLMEVLNKYALA